MWTKIFGPAVLLSTGLVGATLHAGSFPELSEIRVDQPGPDNDEYFEIQGPPGFPLDGLTLITIGDGAGGSGVIEAVVGLNGQVLDPSGFFVAAENTFTLGVPNLITTLNFENTDNVTHVLVQGFSGLINQDLDTNNDGVLDILPWAGVVDAVGMVLQPNPPATTEWAYGASLGFVDIGPDGTFAPGHVYRCQPENAWQIGAFDPIGGQDSAGFPNPSCPFFDCNGNLIPDSQDIALGFSLDLNDNQVPDECDLDVIFCQLSWLDDFGGYNTQFSDWGQMGLMLNDSVLPYLYPGEGGGLYGWLNVQTFVDEYPWNWSIRNYPIFVPAGANLSDDLRSNLRFSLGTIDGFPGFPGEVASSISYSYTITPQPIPLPQFGATVYGRPVVQYDVAWGGGADELTGSLGGTTTYGLWMIPAFPWGDPAFDVRILCPPHSITVKETDIPAVSEETNGCAPGSVARSLKYLQQQFPSLGLTDGAQDIYDDLRDAMESSVGAGSYGTYLTRPNPTGQRGLIPGKTDYLIARGIGNKIETTTTTDFETAGECLDDGADIELFVFWGTDGGGQSMGAHFAFISSIQAVKDGNGNVLCWFVDYIDDPKQGDGTAANEKHTLKFNADGTLDGHGTGAGVLTFIIEKKVDEVMDCARVLGKLDRAIGKIDALIQNLPPDHNTLHNKINEIIIQLQGAIRQLQAIQGGGPGSCPNNGAIPQAISVLNAAISLLQSIIANPGMPPADIINALVGVRNMVYDVIGMLNAPPCPADIDNSGQVDFNDLLILLSQWGPCAGCPADFDNSGFVDFSDLLTLLAEWGPC